MLAAQQGLVEVLRRSREGTEPLPTLDQGRGGSLCPPPGAANAEPGRLLALEDHCAGRLWHPPGRLDGHRPGVDALYGRHLFD